MRHIDPEVNRPPFGATATLRRTGIRLQLQTKGHAELMYADLSRAAAESLRDDLTAALIAKTEAAG